jgi:hypothetical protein
MFVESGPQKDIEEMITSWKKFNLSKEQAHFVKYIEHFYENKTCSFFFPFSFHFPYFFFGF